MEQVQDNAGFGIRSRVLAGGVLAVLLVGGAGGWASTAKLSGAVMAQASVMVDEELKAIQHRDGGIVRDISVREGDMVEAGRVLIELEDAQTKAELSIVRSQIAEGKIRQARLLAERDGIAAIEVPSGIDPTDPETAFLLLGETRLFEGNLTNRESKKQQLELSIRQIGNEISGLEAQAASKADEIGLVRAEHDKMHTLMQKGLVEESRLTPLRREQAKLAGEAGEVEAGIARAEARISEVQLQILAIDEEGRTEAQRELGGVIARLSELQDREVAIEDRLARTEIRSPITGVVNELSVHTIGGVVSPAEVLVTIVPKDAKLMIEAKFLPTSIDQLHEGQPARLMFTSFNQRTTPELEGVVGRVSAAATRDAASGQHFFIAEITVDDGELSKLPSRRLLPGTPVDVFIQTEDRTALSYLAKPMTDQFNKAFRER